MSNRPLTTPHGPFRYVYRIGCGCRAEWGCPDGSRLWKVLHRCKRHPAGVIPVRTMRLV